MQANPPAPRLSDVVDALDLEVRPSEPDALLCASPGWYLTFCNNKSPHSNLDGHPPDRACFNQPQPIQVAA